MDNLTMMQYFEWNLPADGLLWRRVAGQAESLHANGIDIVWLPPAYKGAAGARDVGYGVYDTYDLGEFDQKGSIHTKYGNKSEYIQAIRALQKAGISVLADIVLNHRIGADETEQVEAEKYNPENRLQAVSGEEQITAWTKYTFPGRKGKYSSFVWDWTCFSGIDWDDRSKQGGVYQFEGKEWSPEVDGEKGNFDYLMGADVDMNNPKVVAELKAWGEWYQKTTGADGFRLDAVKHIDYGFYCEWLDAMRKSADKELFAVGEYWSGELQDLREYLDHCEDRMSLFDVPLHMNFYNASTGQGNFDMAKLLKNSLVSSDSMHAVTFVDNHDSQPGQSLQSWIEGWFKPLAYAAILLRRDGLPCVFYSDYYGLRHEGLPPVPGIKRMLWVRKRYAYGEQQDYFDDGNVVGWTRQGDAEHKSSGCAVLMTDGAQGQKTMYVGKQFATQFFYDVLARAPKVEIDENGNGTFFVAGGSVSIWVSWEAYLDVAQHCE